MASKNFEPKHSSSPMEGPITEEVSKLCLEPHETLQVPKIYVEPPTLYGWQNFSDTSENLLDQSPFLKSTSSSFNLESTTEISSQSSIPLKNKNMEDAIAERLSRFLITTTCDQIGDEPVIVSPSLPYDTLLNYYKYVADFLVGPDFFNEEPSQDRNKQAPHKRLEEALTMAQCDVSFVASDLMDGAYKIGPNSWGRFLAPLDWLCKTVDDLGLHNWKAKLKLENEGKLSFEEELEAEERQLDMEIEDFETQLKVNEEKLESQKEENAKLAEELSSLKQIYLGELNQRDQVKNSLDKINFEKERLLAKHLDVKMKFVDIDKRIKKLEMLNEMLKFLLMRKPFTKRGSS